MTKAFWYAVAAVCFTVAALPLNTGIRFQYLGVACWLVGTYLG